ncbi:hypothetical protein PMIN06_011972 [Paraphaeosphaeria minitans]
MHGQGAQPHLALEISTPQLASTKTHLVSTYRTFAGVVASLYARTRFSQRSRLALAEKSRTSLWSVEPSPGQLLIKTYWRVNELTRRLKQAYIRRAWFDVDTGYANH